MYKNFLFAACCALVILMAMSNQRIDAAANGQAVFASLHCNSCHKPDTDKVGASLQLIADTYAAKTELLDYLDGRGEPRIAPERKGVMKGQLKKIAKLTDEEKQALAEYIMTFKKAE